MGLNPRHRVCHHQQLEIFSRQTTCPAELRDRDFPYSLRHQPMLIDSLPQLQLLPHQDSDLPLLLHLDLNQLRQDLSQLLHLDLSQLLLGLCHLILAILVLPRNQVFLHHCHLHPVNPEINHCYRETGTDLESDRGLRPMSWHKKLITEIGNMS